MVRHHNRGSLANSGVGRIIAHTKVIWLDLLVLLLLLVELVIVGWRRLLLCILGGRTAVQKLRQLMRLLLTHLNWLGYLLSSQIVVATELGVELTWVRALLVESRAKLLLLLLLSQRSLQSNLTVHLLRKHIS